jgi:hypothetical protein
VLRGSIIETREVSPDDTATGAESQDKADYRIGRKEGADHTQSSGDAGMTSSGCQTKRCDSAVFGGGE